MTHSPAPHLVLLTLAVVTVWVVVSILAGVAMAWWVERRRSRRIRAWLPPARWPYDDSDPPPP